MRSHQRPERRAWRRVIQLAAPLLVAGLLPSIGSAQGLDLCNCADLPSLGDLITSDDSTYPEGTVRSGGNLTIPLPPDGILVFDNVVVSGAPGAGLVNLEFLQNAANTPVTLLVKGDFTLGSSNSLQVNGKNGDHGNDGGVGGLGGPGGFRGGNGGFLAGRNEPNGSPGLGPGGGTGGLAATNENPEGGTFVGNEELLPLVGGSGGGGGYSDGAATSCRAGGGGGGGGAFLLAVNGTITLNSFSAIRARGGVGGGSGSLSCASAGSQGSGGAIRLVAGRITGTGFIQALAGGSSGTPGRIRIEAALEDSFPANNSSPLAFQTRAVGPIALPSTPTVAITAVGGAVPPDPPGGWQGEIDIVVSQPGPVDLDVETTGVPAGTTVRVTAKPESGNEIVEQDVPLETCDGTGLCTATATLDLLPGAYAAEARATFQVP